MAGLFGGIFGGAAGGAGAAGAPPGGTAPAAVTIAQLDGALFVPGRQLIRSLSIPEKFHGGGANAAITSNVAAKASYARTSGDQLFSIPAHLQLHVSTNLRNHLLTKTPSHYAGAGHRFPAMDAHHFTFEGLNPVQLNVWAGHVLRAYSKAAAVSDLDATILHTIAMRTEAGDTSFGALRIGTTDWTIFKKLGFVRAFVAFLGLMHPAPKLIEADQFVTAMGFQSVADTDPTVVAGAAGIASMVAAEDFLAIDKVHAFLAHGIAIFLRSGGISADSDASGEERYGMVRRVAELIGWPELMSSRSVGERQRKEKQATTIAGLVLGLTFPGALACLYAPQAHVHYNPAAALNLPANADGPAPSL